MKRGLALVCLSAFCVAGFVAQAPAQDRILVDVGLCWSDPMEYPGVGPVVTPDGSGHHWNNFSGNPRWGWGPIDLVDVDNDATGIQMGMKAWSGCGDGDQMISGREPGGLVSNLYPELAQTDCRWWDTVAGGNGTQPGEVYLTGMDPCKKYDIGMYGYIAPGTSSAIYFPYPEGTTIYSIGAQSIEIDIMGNTTDLAWFNDVSPDASGAITVVLVGGTPQGCGAALNVVEIWYNPYPAPGDATADGCIDGADYTGWADNYEPGVVKVKYSEGGWTIGEWTDDGIVDGADYTAWADNYECGCDAQVPEPITLVVVACGALVCLARRRRAS